jgi:hypothetical protein
MTSRTKAMAYDIEIRGDDATVAFAAQELKRYLGQALRGPRIAIARNAAPGQAGFVVAQACDVPETVDPAIVRDGEDLDQIFIRSRDRQVVLAGNNPRSVLFAIYDFLERLGCRWLHPGPDGERVPRLKALPSTPWNVTQTASFRYRGVCVEGAFTPKHANAFVDWMAKKKMNHLYMQLENGTFWYRRLAPGLSISGAIAWDHEIMAEVKRRGLLLEWYGHGWNHNSLGKHVVCLTKAYKMPEKLRPFIAEVNGKRAWHNNYPHETQLCLTNPVVRKKVLACVERVIRRNPHVDILGLWLADGYNNQCECVNCRQFRMSELYAQYVNSVAEIAHRIRPGLKIEILAYMSTLEFPKRFPIKNPHGNLILMLAPLCRCYRHRLHDPRCLCPVQIPKSPVLNKQPGLGLGNWDFVRAFQGWRKRYAGDTYLFDYHMLILSWDFLGGNMPAIASQDIKDLAKNGFDGYVGCQNLRCFWPTGLGMQVIAETLWDVRRPYAAIRQEHLAEWFGRAATAAGKALDGMYAATGGIGHNRWPSRARLLKARASLASIAADLRHVGAKQTDPVVRRRLGFLADHAEYLADQLLLAPAYKASDAAKEAANNRLTAFFVKHAQDAEFLLVAQYHGKAFLNRKPARKLLGGN